MQYDTPIIIYGAQAIALGTYKAIKKLSLTCLPECFLVTEMGDNAETLAGIPVRELKDYSAMLSQEKKENIVVLIATPETVMEAIEESLRTAGFSHYVRIDSLRWARLQQQAFSQDTDFCPLSEYQTGIQKPWLRVYKAKFYRDKVLETSFSNPEYMIDLQVGAARTEIRVAELLDNTGDNISERNADYSELTGLYWMWKNQVLKDGARAEHYYGLAHYRRFFELTQEDLLRMQDNGVDVVLPYPMPYEPNIEAHHKRYLSKEEWRAVLKALEELSPEYTTVFAELLKQEYMYNYNILIAKGNILENYCSWLFKILFRVEEIINPDGLKYPNRYIGYIGETLETLYFMYHRRDLRIAHAGCRFLT